jgi:hypothetical protein
MATPERPLLIAPVGAREPLWRRPQRGIGAQGPKKARQTQRLAPAFAALASALAQRRASLQGDPSGAVLEQVLVLETNGPVAELYDTLATTPGLEWLADEDLRDVAPDNDFFVVGKPAKLITAQLYLVLFNQEAIEQLLSLWRMWSSKPSRVQLPTTFSGWSKVFGQLRDIRPWGVRDRLSETLILDFWRDRVRAGYETVSVEIELWFRASARRSEAESRVRAYVEKVQGRVTGTCVLEPIAYHAIIAKLPIHAVESMLDDPEVALLQCEDVRLVRPTGQGAPPGSDEEATSDAEADVDTLRAADPGLRPPVVALLDGLPLENHRRLAGRLVVDDPDGWAETYTAERRVHGTGMASLILHADIGGKSPASGRRLYVRPILRPDEFGGNQELAPDGVAWVDLIHRAVHRIVEGDGGEPAAAPTVKVINLSIGDSYQPFLRTMSPLSRLLDWLAWRYQVLFVVCAGNHPGPIVIQGTPTPRAALAAVAAEHRHRRLLSPAEAINVLTVGASSEDDAGPWAPRGPGETDFPLPPGVPSLISAWGRGYRRTVKPDVLAPGGRTVFVPRLASAPGESSFDLAANRARFAPGHTVATPGPSAGDLTATRFSSGTSNSAALTSRLAGSLADTLEDLANEPNADRLRAVPTALWIRTLVAHSASWRPDAVNAVVEAVRSTGRPELTTDDLAGILGFGRIEADRALGCTPTRATLLAGGALRADERMMHRIPLPSSLNAHTGWRRLTITLSWFSPIHAAHRKYRRAQLWFDPPTDPLVVKRFGVDWLAAKRGTLQHEVLEGQRAAVNIQRDATLDIPVSCVEDAGTFSEPIPYALAVTIEVASGVNVRVYDEIRSRIYTRVAVRP